MRLTVCNAVFQFTAKFTTIAVPMVTPAALHASRSHDRYVVSAIMKLFVKKYDIISTAASVMTYLTKCHIGRLILFLCKYHTN